MARGALQEGPTRICRASAPGVLNRVCVSGGRNQWHTRTHNLSSSMNGPGAGGGRDYCRLFFSFLFFFFFILGRNDTRQVSLAIRSLFNRRKKERNWRVPTTSCFGHKSQIKKISPYLGQDRLVVVAALRVSSVTTGQTVNSAARWHVE